MRDLAAQPFATLNKGYNSVFKPGRLSVGLVVPITAYPSSVTPDMRGHLQRIQLAERLGFSAVWLRDVPFNVPSFGDAGQLFDPFTYLGYLAGQTQEIALGVASIILPLRHPAHVAKAAASVDVLSGGRLILGIASGDRPEEYPAMNASFDNRSERFRDSVNYMRAAGKDWPVFNNTHGHLDGTIDMLPKPTADHLPLLITGSSRQSPDWIAAHGDGWMTYPRPLPVQAQAIEDWRAQVALHSAHAKPVLQPLYVDLADDPAEPPRPIHLGFRSGEKPLIDYLKKLEALGVNHIALNLRFNRADISSTLDRLAETVLPHFSK